jgi:spermidine/putrescine transport system ATP-binding protein
MPAGEARRQGDLWGKLENIVYFGTDTHFHVKLDGGADFIVRQQNARGGGEGHATGDAVGIKLATTPPRS